MTEKQLATLESLRDQIEAIWIKMGGKYEEMGERDLHVIAFKKGITRQLRSKFSAYEGTEAYRAIGFFIKLKAGYQRMWNKQWTGEVAERAREHEEDLRIQKECLTWDQVMEWMRGRPLMYEFPVCHFEHVKTIDNVGYWKRRETTLKLYRRMRAEDIFRTVGFRDRGYEFFDVFDPWSGPGHDGVLYKVKEKYEEYVH